MGSGSPAAFLDRDGVLNEVRLVDGAPHPPSSPSELRLLPHVVADDIRPDVQHENGFIRYLPRWFNHLELRFNAAACDAASTWLAERL